MNEHDMISNISYIMRLYPETTEKILIKHGADPSKECWTDGCDVAGAYEELLQWLNSRYDRNDQDTELDYHIQEILGWHDMNESVESELEIPAPYNQYYEFSPNEVDFDELPDAFDNYKDLKVVAELYAKEQYEDALADNALDFCWLVEDEIGKLLLVTTAGLRVYPITLEEILDCVGESSYDDDYDDYDDEDLDEAVELTDAQRLALNELDAALACGEVTEEEHDAGQNVQWDINFEDVVLFINGIDVALSDVTHVEYGDCTEYDGCYSVTMKDGAVKKFGWYDGDMSGTLYHVEDCADDIQSAITEMTPDVLTEDVDIDKFIQINGGHDTVSSRAGNIIDSHPGISVRELAELLSDDDSNSNHVNLWIRALEYLGIADDLEECLNEDVTDGWDKPFSWTQVYKKDGFMISDNYNGTFHLEQTSPTKKHIGNYRSLEAAKAAGDAEIANRNKQNANKPTQFGVHSFTSDSIIFRGTEEECAEYINKNGLENEAEIYMMTANDRHYFEEAAGKRFNNGDRVYVTVSNRQGTVTQMVSDDVVEVEFEANGTYPARIDRFYTDEVKLIFDDVDEQLDSSEEFWAVFATDRSTGKEYCAGVFDSESNAHYNASLDYASDSEFGYGDFKYRVEQVSDYSPELDSSRKQLNALKLANHATAKNGDFIADDEF